jgi:hypothetical protein
MKKLIIIFTLFIFLNVRCESKLNLLNYIFPAIVGLYTSSTIFSAHTNYTLMNLNKNNKFYHTVCFAKDILKIFFVIWLTYYIRTFTINKFLKSSLIPFTTIRYWI